MSAEISTKSNIGEGQVSIRPSPAGQTDSHFGPGPQGGVQTQNSSPMQLLTFAYQALSYQFVDALLPRCRFYERGCQEKYLTADRPTGIKPIVAASPASVETNDFNQLCGHSAPHHNVMSSSETEKRCGG